MTTQPATNTLEIVISREPRLAAIGNKNLQSFIASQMLAFGLDFDEAQTAVLGLIQGADQYKAEVKAEVTAKRDESEKTVKDTLTELILATMGDLKVSPQYGLTVFYDPRYSYKNTDGSPMMDEKNNPVVKPFVEFKFQWDNKVKGSRTVGDTSNMGRPEGDYLIDGEVFKSMAAFAKAKWPDEFAAHSGTSRDFLTAKGYTVPTEPETDSEGKKHFTLAKAA